MALAKIGEDFTLLAGLGVALLLRSSELLKFFKLFQQRNAAFLISGFPECVELQFRAGYSDSHSFTRLPPNGFHSRVERFDFPRELPAT